MEERRVLSISPVQADLDTRGTSAETSAYYASASEADEVVTFPDANLEAAVRDALGMPTGDLTRDVLATLTDLIAVNVGIRDLTGLEACTGLENLDLHWNEISDLTPIQDLVHLERLLVFWNQIEDVTPVQGLTNLKTASFGGNNIQDVSPLGGLLSLEILHVDNNRIQDVSALASLTNLRNLLVAHNELVDIAPISKLGNLTRLGAENNAIEELPRLDAWVSLEELNLSANEIRDVSPLTAIPNLREVSLRINYIEDITPLVEGSNLISGDAIDLTRNPLSRACMDEQIPTLVARGVQVEYDANQHFLDVRLEETVCRTLGITPSELTADKLESLTTLDASIRQIRFLDGIEACTNLESLDLFANEVEDTMPLSGLENLKTLDLSDNPVSDMSPVWHLTTLVDLDLAATGLSDLAGIENLVTLTKLDLNNNSIEDVEPLSSLTNLSILYMFWNEIRDVTPLAELPQLEELTLWHNSISDVSPLAVLSNLTYLSVSQNRVEDISPLATLTSVHKLHLDSNLIEDISPLAQLTNVDNLWLHDNQITDISAFVESDNLGPRDLLRLQQNPLSDACRNEQIPALVARGVTVQYDDVYAHAGGPYVTTAGSSIWLGSLLPDSSMQYAWDLDDDGEYDDGFGAYIRYFAKTEGTANVGLRVTEPDGLVGTDTTTIDVAAASGFAIQGADAVVGRGAEVVLGSVMPEGLEGEIVLAWSATREGREVAIATGGEFALPTGVCGDYLVSLTVSADGEVVGTATQAVRVVEDLGAVDATLKWTVPESPQTDTFHRIVATRDAWLTLAGQPQEPGSEVQLTLYDADFRPLASFGDESRIDWPALPEETYFFTVSAPAGTEVWIQNAVACDDGHVTVIGSDEADTIQIGDRESNRKIELNGLVYQFDAEVFLSVTYHGNGGGDIVTLFDTEDDDTLEIHPQQLAASNGSGTWSVAADGFATLHAYSLIGGNDVAVLHDSPKSDKFKTEPDVAKMLHPGTYYNRVKAFSEVRGVSSNGGADRGLLRGSTGDDRFIARKDEARLEGDGFACSAEGFPLVYAWGMGGQDVATLTDSALDDVVRARPHKVCMWAGDYDEPEYSVVARAFDDVSLQATEGGFDKAKLHDTANDDLLEIGWNSARMNRSAENLEAIYEALAFEFVKAYSTSGEDSIDGDSASCGFQLVLDGTWDEP